MPAPAPVHVIADPERAATVLQPLRVRLMERLTRAPNSASGLAREVGLPRQQINYHLRELEREGFLELVEERRRGNCIERLVQATARSYVVSPEALGRLGDIPVDSRDRFSSAYLVAVAARLLRDVSILRRRAQRARKPLPTLTLQAEVRFRSASDRNAMAEELAQAFARIAARYHDDGAQKSRLYRFMLGAHPAITKTPEEARAEERAESGEHR